MHLSPMRATSPANLIFLDLITLIKHYMMTNKNREAPSRATTSNLLLHIPPPPQPLGPSVFLSARLSPSIGAVH